MTAMINNATATAAELASTATSLSTGQQATRPYSDEHRFYTEPAFQIGGCGRHGSFRLAVQQVIWRIIFHSLCSITAVDK